MLRALLTAVFALLIAQAQADERAQTRQQIEAAAKDINELKRALGHLSQQKSQESSALKTIESQIGELNKNLNALKAELAEGEQELKRLNAEKAVHEKAKQAQQALIASQARAAYQTGRQEYLKLLLNQQNPEKLSRSLTYYDYLNKARLEQLATFNETLRQLNNVQADIEAAQARLLVRQGTLDETRQSLNKALAERKAALTALAAKEQTHTSRLSAREREREQLNSVLKTIEQTLARQAREAEQRRQAEQAARAAAQSRSQAPHPQGPEVTTGSAQRGSFAQARAKLPWPVNGRILARFGSPRGEDPRSRWDGVMIGAAAGSSVKAIHAGRVVFADWLRGAGLLVIVDHGNGYLSLYGHNQSILKKAGDSVRAGETLSTVGTSGGQQSPALYFAIRQQGRAVDPQQWCRTQ